MVQLSVNVPNFGSTLAGGDWSALLDACVAAEDAGFDRVLVTDHVVMGSDTDDYTWSAFPSVPDDEWLEPLSVLAAVAARTSRIRLATGIVIAALRGGALLAKTAATVDRLSGGRLELGVGTGWQKREYEAVGLDFGERGRLLDDTLDTCRALWSSAPATIRTSAGEVGDVYCSPRRPIPVWVSGSASKAVIARTVRYGDGWIPIMGIDDDTLAEQVRVFRKAFADAGRDPESLQVRGRLSVVRGGDGEIDLDATVEHSRTLVAAGATDLVVPFAALGGNPDERRATMQALRARA
ncbi:TIGR03619 family F420-dependent LLM class oxidoreductase [Rhodococcus rhodnii]|uniref:Monooxygenase n=2 Tax=Rhodococcus rhodnii TaxID=38312 RepID=R7WQE8_9NOCA|nr:TIGR03619 family F420-dependent LLM class oxidoreductase [Rhodococcus rhodnii]EOM77495.1 monooxygenase [Rhodococcus rhodnii LMG 5362]TXG90364.1 TIGR03619 family F420-dependent LLM class oxidoreductase [Rhodococcus rhodnii]